MLALIFSVLSGALAASTAAWSKVAQQPNYDYFGYKSELSENVKFLVRFGTYTLGNILMWIMFVTALKRSPNVTVVLILNNITNLYLSVSFRFSDH